MGRKSRVAEAELMLQEIQGSSFEVEPEEKEIIVEATNVFYRNQAAKARIVLNRGGRGSSKSFSLIQLMLHKFFCEDRKKICILRKSLPSLRQSVHMQMCDLANEYGLMDRIVVEKVHMNWYYNGAMIHFGSVDESSKIRSSNWNVFFIEEATEITYDEWQDIRFCLREPSRDGRRNQAYFAFNPIDEFHWIKEKIVDDPEMEEGVDYEEIVSSYRDNPFLDADSINDLVKLERQDPSLYNIFTLGNWGRLDNLIYYNWSTVPIMPSEDAMDWVSYGLDFGFNAPSALIKGYFKKPDQLWEEEMLYHTQMTNSDLIVKLKDIIPEDKRRKHIIWADSERPDCIKEINQAGFICKPAIKQIKAGIDQVKRLNCHLFEGSINLIKEKRGYSWKKDRRGNVTDEPVDFLNHLMDPERYMVHSMIAKKHGGVNIRFFD